MQRAGPSSRYSTTTTWSPTKLARQLEAVDSVGGDHWVVSSRMSVLGPGNRRRRWPRRLIEPGQSIAEYLFRFDGLGFGNANLQTSTLCFPTSLGRSIRWGGTTDLPHDEPSWLIRAQRTVPDLRVIQLPDTLSIYDVRGVRSPATPPTGLTPTSSGDCDTSTASRPACSETTSAPARSAPRCRPCRWPGFGEP